MLSSHSIDCSQTGKCRRLARAGSRLGIRRKGASSSLVAYALACSRGLQPAEVRTEVRTGTLKRAPQGKSKQQLEGELHLPVSGSVGDHAEIRASQADAGTVEVRRIGQVVRFRAEIQGHRFADRKTLS